MPVPRVFISSTCYDLGPIRFDLQRFVEALGYEPILSERGQVLYDPAREVVESAVEDVQNCDLLVLLIGGRFGSEFPGGDGISVTNAEYRSAIRHEIPVFALVHADVLHDMHTYEANKNNSLVDVEQITYPSVDSTAIFGFINEVRAGDSNNALHPFQEFTDISSYLLNQWASLFRMYLSQRTEERRVADTLTEIQTVNRKIEALSELVARTIAPEETAKVNATLDQQRNASRVLRYLIDTLGVDRGLLNEADPLPDASDLKLRERRSLPTSTSFELDYHSLQQLPLATRQELIAEIPTRRPAPNTELDENARDFLDMLRQANETPPTINQPENQIPN